MELIGMIWLFGSGLCWCASPDRVGAIGAAVFASLGLILMTIGVLL